MNFKLQALALAAAALTAGTAQADIFNVGTGDGSVYFIAIDADANIAFTADTGMRVSNFTNQTTYTSGLTAPVTFNFETNASSANFDGTEAWSTAYATFKSTQTGGNFLWGVVAGDNVSAGTVTNRNTLSTGNATQAQMLALTTTAPISNALTAFAGWEAATNTKGNIAAASTNGAAALTSSDGGAWLNAPGSIFGNFNGTNTWNYLLSNGALSTFQRAQQATGGVITQFGNPNAIDSLSAAPVTWSFDIATNTLTLAPAIPEPSTYAMLVAGLAAVGFMARRRKA